jgi:transposase-like protein
MHFWQYLDEFMKKYKGIGSDSFVYYLKEAEFKFNYPDKTKRYRILKKLVLDTF